MRIRSRFLVVAVAIALMSLAVACGQSQSSLNPAGPYWLPSPPAGAQTFTNIQNDSGWGQCDTSGCSGSATGVGTYTLKQNVASPSLSGSALEVTATMTSGTYYNVLTYNKSFGCGTVVGGCNPSMNRYFLEDFWVYFPSSNTVIGAYEYDPDMFDGAYKYEASVQCDKNTGDWRMWNQSAVAWAQTTYSCTSFMNATGVWHHIQIYGYWDVQNQTYMYIDFFVDGQKIWYNLFQQFSAHSDTTPATFNVQFQMDIGTTLGTVTEYIDKWTLTVW